MGKTLTQEIVELAGDSDVQWAVGVLRDAGCTNGVIYDMLVARLKQAGGRQ